MNPFNSLDNLKNQFTSVTFCRNTGVYNVRNGVVIELPVDISINGFSSSLIGGGLLLSTLLSVMLSISLLTNEV